MYRFLITGINNDKEPVNFIQTFNKKRPTSIEVIDFIKINKLIINNIILLEQGDNSIDKQIDIQEKSVATYGTGVEFMYKNEIYVTQRSTCGCNGCSFNVSNKLCPSKSCIGLIFKKKE